MKYLKIILLQLFIVTLSGIYAQIDNKALYNDIRTNEVDSNKFYFSFINQNILIDNEYFKNIATGYTLWATQINPQLAYVPNKHLKIQAGIFLQKDYGNPALAIVQPTFSVKLHKNGYSFIFGNLESCLTHQLIQPIFNYERVFTNPLESGAQFKIDKKRLWFDIWIDWEQQEYQNVSFKEHIGAGMSSKITLYNHNDIFKIIVPVQGFVFHHGGQLDLNTTSLLTLMNGAVGVTFDWKLPNKFITNIRSDNYLLGFNNGSTQKNVFPFYTTFTPNTPNFNNLTTFPQSIYNGTGSYYNITVTSKYNLSLMASYWEGNNFVAGHGGALYQSVSSIYGQNYMETNRRLVFLRAIYKYEIFPDVFIDARFEPYYDLRGGFSEYCYSAFVTYRKDFALGKDRTKKAILPE